MKEMYVLLCLILVLFIGSCSDLAMDDEAAVKADLPADFNWQTYAEINNDVKVSQIIFDVREKNKEYKGADSATKAESNCVNVLQDENFSKKLYVEYLQCPELGWDPNKKCSGKYAYNNSYTKESKTDTTCAIDGCWSGGWSELQVYWQDSLAKKSTTVKAMCQFIPKAANSAEVQTYLTNFPFDSYLIEQHYHFFGRSDGRPYKYCGSSSIGEEKTRSLADSLFVLSDTQKNVYYDYGRYTFCLSETDQKIYVVK